MILWCENGGARYMVCEHGGACILSRRSCEAGVCCVAQLQISLTYKVVELVQISLTSLQIDMPARPPRSERRNLERRANNDPSL